MPSLPGGPHNLPQRILTASEGGHIRRNLYKPLSALATSPKVGDYVAIAGFPLHCLDLCFVRTKKTFLVSVLSFTRLWDFLGGLGITSTSSTNQQETHKALVRAQRPRGMTLHLELEAMRRL